MVTLYTGGNQVIITYVSGITNSVSNTVSYSNIAGIGYRPGKLLIIWKDYTIKQVDKPADSYTHIVCPGRFDIDIE